MANAGVEGKLFGSITAADIADQLNAAGAEIDRNEVRLPSGPLRHTGEYNIDVQLHADVIVTVKVDVTSEAELQAKAAAEEAAKAKAAALEEAEAIAKAQEEE
jgi:large subunit ribosomal protein L9